MKNAEEKNKMHYVVIALICVLLLFSVVQAVQINNIKDAGGSITGGVSVASSGGSSAQVSPPPRTAVPTMVGGC